MNPEFCEECERTEARIIDSRSTEQGRRRRYQCLNVDCNYRWTTYESKDPSMIGVLNQLSDLDTTLEVLTKHLSEAKSQLSTIRRDLSKK